MGPAAASGGLLFEQGPIADVAGEDRFDVVLPNASLRWLLDPERLLPRHAAPGGQLAVQMIPANGDHPSRGIAAAMAEEPEFGEALGGSPPEDPARGVLAAERYADLLAGLGVVHQHVPLQVDGHRLASTDEWAMGAGHHARVLSAPPP